MKKKIKFPYIGHVLFFLLICIVSLTSIFVFSKTYQVTENLLVTAIATFASLLILSIIALIIDILRRKYTEEIYLKEIINSTNKIAEGDFSKKIVDNIPFHEDNPYYQIIDNINTMIDELRNNEVLKNDFIANVSHELKSPLAQIQNNTKMLEDDNLSLEERKIYLNNINSSLIRLSSLISNILKLNKLENSSLNYVKEEFDLSELIRMNIIDYEEKIEEKNLELNIDIDDISYYGEKDLVNIIVSNLISNAYKFTNKGSISISLKEEGNYIIFIVKDTGKGISSTLGKRIFDKFYQIDPSINGNGLGLALSKKALEIIGGELNVDSEVDKGSTFSLRLYNEKNS